MIICSFLYTIYECRQSTSAVTQLTLYSIQQQSMNQNAWVSVVLWIPWIFDGSQSGYIRQRSQWGRSRMLCATCYWNTKRNDRIAMILNLKCWKNAWHAWKANETPTDWAIGWHARYNGWCSCWLGHSCSNYNNRRCLLIWSARCWSPANDLLGHYRLLPTYAHEGKKWNFQHSPIFLTCAVVFDRWWVSLKCVFTRTQASPRLHRNYSFPVSSCNFPSVHRIRWWYRIGLCI